MDSSPNTRKLLEINISNIPESYNPQASIIKGTKADGSYFKVDIGRICYIRREKDSGNSFHKAKEYQAGFVDVSSLSLERVKWLRKYLSHIFSSGCRAETLRAKLHYIRYFFNFCDFNGSKPTTLEELIFDYQCYQNHLFQRGRISGESSLSSSSIYIRLNTARNFLKVAYDLSNTDMLTLVPKYRYTVSNTREMRTVNLEDGQAYLQACILYFNQFADAILQKKYPVNVTPPNSYSDDLYWHAPAGTTLKSLPGCFNEHGDPLPFEDIKNTIKKNFKGRQDKSEFYNKTLIHNRNEWINKELNFQKIYAYNLCTFCFFQLYLGFTAANVQPTLDLRLSDLDLSKIGSSAFAEKHKYRAGRKVKFTAPSHLKREILKYLKLREWAENLKINRDVEDFLFVSISESRSLKRMHRDTGDSLIKSSPLFREITKISSRNIRNLSGEYFIRQSKGKLSLVAKKLNNSIATVAKSYTSIDLETQAVEMNQFHEEICSRVRQFNRNTNEPVPVKVSIDCKTERVAAGSCANLSEKIPLRAKGFNTEAPEPNCGTFESCLFCEYFAIHTDFEDIHKLLSLKDALLHTSIIRNDPEHHQAVVEPALFRIDEIFELLRQKDISITELIDKVEQQIEMGIYNEHWEKQIQTLITVASNMKCEL